MKFTVVSHACLYVETPQARVLFDPWIVGSCYWRSWWNLPEPEPALIASLNPTHIYLTHLHWDHFHGQSLRRFSPDTTILIPETVSDRFVEDLRWIGFTDIRSIPNGDAFAFGDGVTLHSYQFGAPADSAAVITDGRTVLFNINDCKVFGAPLRKIRRRFPTFDFVFRSHSSASAVPQCIEGYEERFGDVLDQQGFIEEFAAFGLHVGARYMIPFASNHCFLHRETERFNANAVNPAAVAEHYNRHAQALGSPSRCVVMPSGSSWDADAGFDVRPFDYDKRDEYIAGLKQKHAAKLAAQDADEAKAHGDFAAFKQYFDSFLSALPAALLPLLPPRVVIRVRESDRTRDWIIELRGPNVVEMTDPPSEKDLVFEMAALVVNDCVTRRMFGIGSPSKRMKIRCAGPLRHAYGFLVMLELFETGYFPLRGLFSRQKLRILRRRIGDLPAFAEAFGRLAYARAIARAPLKTKSFFPVAASKQDFTADHPRC